MDDWRLNQQMQDDEDDRRRCILWEAANQISENGINEESAIWEAEQLQDERDDAFHNNGDTFLYQDPKLAGVTASNRKQAIAIYHKLCDKESLAPNPYPFT
ncbi:hypothetical protein [Pasteurella multocida]|uniref:hypothetical protein n=1 Tax=Pasteurella multocida TaxID=747 RepID=UPI000D3CBE66|nr:hypothetical protein [Pasteurella multocida]AWB52373.1 hypothetical protein DB278_02160 [Pasteurella multocida]